MFTEFKSNHVSSFSNASLSLDLDVTICLREFSNSNKNSSGRSAAIAEESQHVTGLLRMLNTTFVTTACNRNTIPLRMRHGRANFQSLACILHHNCWIVKSNHHHYHLLRYTIACVYIPSPCHLVSHPIMFLLATLCTFRSDCGNSLVISLVIFI